MRSILSTIVILLFSLSAFSQISLDSTLLPIIMVETFGGSIPDEPKVDANMMIVDNGAGNYNKPTDTPNDYDGRIGIELRGSSSQFFDKKSYGVETRTATNQDTSVSILGLPVEEDWVFHGPFSDKSLIRNVLAFELASHFGRYASRYRMFELIIDGDYKGVYVLLEKVKRDNDRIDISRLRSDENAGDSLTGGYIIKIDKFDGTNSGAGFVSQYRPPNYVNDDQVIYFQFDYPKGRDITSQQAAYIEQYMASFEDVLKGPNFADPNIGYRSLIDELSFVDYALLAEISKNVDAYRLSTFMYKDRIDNGGGKLVLGPPWDYNLAFGNADYYEGGNTSGWQWNMNVYFNQDFWLNPFWWSRLRQDGQHAQLMVDRWNELRAGPWSDSNITAFIDSMYIVLEEPAQRNFQRWPILDEYIWPNVFVAGSYFDHVDYMKDYVISRAGWIDDNLPEILLISGVEDKLEAAGIRIYPNPAEDHLTLSSENTQIRSIELIDPLGRVVLSEATLTSQTQIEVSTYDPGVYVLRLQLDDRTLSSRVVIR